MMKVIVVGAGGMLGQEIVDVFALEHDVVALTHEDFDITFRERVFEKMAVLEPQLIINCAAFKDVRAAEGKKDVAFAVNEQGAAHLAAAAESVHAILMHFSTDYVFDGTQHDGYLETDTPCPINIYGASKYAGELRVLENCSRTYIIRTAWLFGRKKHNFVLTIRNAAQTKPKLAVVSDQHGCPTYTRDLAHACLALVGQEFGIYHLTNSGTATWFLFAQEIIKGFGLSTPVDPISTEENTQDLTPRPRHTVLLNTKRPALRHWTEALADYASFLKEERD